MQPKKPDGDPFGLGSASSAATASSSAAAAGSSASDAGGGERRGRQERLAEARELQRRLLELKRENEELRQRMESGDGDGNGGGSDAGGRDGSRGRGGRDSMGGWRKNLKHMSYMPDNQFSHQYSLINPMPLDVREFNQLLNQHVLLGAIDDNELMRYYQDDMVHLVNLFDMAKQDGKVGEAMEYVFNVLYWGWTGEIRMTAVKGGKERDLQSFAHFREKGVARQRDEEGSGIGDLIGAVRGRHQRTPPGQRQQGGGGIYG